MKTQYEKQLKETTDLVNSLPWENEEFYKDFLAQTYHFVCHSTRLLARSISHFGVDRDDLYQRFVSHLKEENYHEKLALKDLEFLGEDISKYPECSFTKSFWQAQFYLIDQSRGTSLLGYILYLEAIAVHSFNGIYKSLSENYSAKACRFVKVHVEEDPEHLEHAIDMIEGLNEREQEEIWKNFYQSAEIYHSMLLRAQLSSKNSIKIAS